MASYDPADLPAEDPRIPQLEELRDLYLKQGVLDGDASAPLCERCPASAECWAEASAPASLKDQGIHFPWIGEDYAEHRVAVVAMNLRYQSGPLPVQWDIARRAIEAFTHKIDPEMDMDFHRSVSGYVHAVVATAEERRRCQQLLGTGVPVTEILSGPQLASARQACALLETVKCVPGGDGQPTDHMWGACPHRYLRHELSILQPRTVLVLGTLPRGQFAPTTEIVAGLDSSGHISTATGTIGKDTNVQVVGLLHPNARFGSRWYDSLAALLAMPGTD